MRSIHDGAHRRARPCAGVTVLDDWNQLDARLLDAEELRIVHGQRIQGSHGALAVHRAYAEHWLTLIDSAVRKAQALVGVY